MSRFKIAGGDVSILRVPLRRAFVTALGRRTDTVNAAITVRLKGGAAGYGEASESIVLSRLKAPAMAAGLRRELARLRGRDLAGLGSVVRGVWERLGGMTPAAAALECALTEAWCAVAGLTLWEWAGGAVERLETDLTLSASDPGTARSAAEEALREGFRTLKVKTGISPAEDLRRLRAVRGATRSLGKRPEIILDGNQGMTLRSALGLMEQGDRMGLKIVLLEQPLPRGRLKEMAALQRRSPVPLAADESVWSPEDALKVLDLGAAKVLNVKVAKTGLAASLRIVALARAAGAGLMIGCMRETARGLAASVGLAAGTGAFRYVDLDSDRLLAAGQPSGGFKRQGLIISVGNRA